MFLSPFHTTLRLTPEHFIFITMLLHWLKALSLHVVYRVHLGARVPINVSRLGFARIRQPTIPAILCLVLRVAVAVSVWIRRPITLVTRSLALIPEAEPVRPPSMPVPRP